MCLPSSRSFNKSLRVGPKSARPRSFTKSWRNWRGNDSVQASNLFNKAKALSHAILLLFSCKDSLTIYARNTWVSHIRPTNSFGSQLCLNIHVLFRFGGATSQASRKTKDPGPTGLHLLSYHPIYLSIYISVIICVNWHGNWHRSHKFDLFGSADSTPISTRQTVKRVPNELLQFIIDIF